jgi:hypothetical protein
MPKVPSTPVKSSVKPSPSPRPSSRPARERCDQLFRRCRSEKRKRTPFVKLPLAIKAFAVEAALAFVKVVVVYERERGEIVRKEERRRGNARRRTELALPEATLSKVVLAKVTVLEVACSYEAKERSARGEGRGKERRKTHPS